MLSVQHDNSLRERTKYIVETILQKNEKCKKKSKERAREREGEGGRGQSTQCIHERHLGEGDTNSKQDFYSFASDLPSLMFPFPIQALDAKGYNLLKRGAAHISRT